MWAEDYNPDDEVVEGEFDEGYTVMTYDEFKEWCRGLSSL